MCGRYSIAVEPIELEERFKATPTENFPLRYNAAPSQTLPVILNSDPSRIMLARWGLRPSWMKQEKRRDGIINVRSETLRDRATFRQDLESRRCLVLADGFYEWKKTTAGRKIPFRVTLRDGAPFAFAGIWEADAPGDAGRATFAIITTTPNALIRQIHTRMPVILKREGERAWLSEAGDPRQLLELLQPIDETAMRMYEVLRRVNSAAADAPELIEPVDAGRALAA